MYPSTKMVPMPQILQVDVPRVGRMRPRKNSVSLYQTLHDTTGKPPKNHGGRGATANSCTGKIRTQAILPRLHAANHRHFPSAADISDHRNHRNKSRRLVSSS
mmetsp:Transcript_28147/g.60352  ORF Transcript_28147/g.60352 Transcript_28147/m.60352 type:complete len:103 (-) Transcript_28147:289-597(-)